MFFAVGCASLSRSGQERRSLSVSILCSFSGGCPLLEAPLQPHRWRGLVKLEGFTGVTVRTKSFAA
jgi:hypothetical protein